MEHVEGFIDFKGYKTWYAVYGDPRSGVTPLLGLHGGPGYPHWHLQNLTELSEQGIPVILYDQLGCGNSDRPDESELWTVGTFVEELGEIRKALGLGKLSILGTSWGGSLALEYLLTKPAGIEKLILHSPLLDTKLWVSEAERLKDTLPTEVAATMRRHEEAGTTDSDEYQEANELFNRQFLFRGETKPDDLIKCEEEANMQVYHTMWGPSESHATGNLRDWSVLDRLNQITTPTLWISGRYDECTPRQVQMGVDLIKDSEWAVLENSSHSSNWEEPEKYLETVSDFLKS